MMLSLLMSQPFNLTGTRGNALGNEELPGSSNTSISIPLKCMYGLVYQGEELLLLLFLTGR